MFSAGIFNGRYAHIVSSLKNGKRKKHPAKQEKKSKKEASHGR
jgi:hypothetical protein